MKEYKEAHEDDKKSESENDPEDIPDLEPANDGSENDIVGPPKKTWREIIDSGNSSEIQHDSNSDEAKVPEISNIWEERNRIWDSNNDAQTEGDSKDDIDPVKTDTMSPVDLIEGNESNHQDSVVEPIGNIIEVPESKNDGATNEADKPNNDEAKTTRRRA